LAQNKLHFDLYGRNEFIYTRHSESGSLGMGRKRVSGGRPHQKDGKSKGKRQSPESVSRRIHIPATSKGIKISNR